MQIGAAGNSARHRALCALSVGLAVAALGLAAPVFAEGMLERIQRGHPKPVDLTQPGGRAEVRRRQEQIRARPEFSASREQREQAFQLFWKLNMWRSMYWLGIPVLKSPSDMWMMQQLIAEVRPDYIIESGTFLGGSALYYAHVLAGLGLTGSKVITIDIHDKTAEASRQDIWKQHVEFIHASSTDEATIARISERVKGSTVMVALDSNHAKHHVLDELRAYAALVPKGSYVVVEDTALDGIPLVPNMPGPLAAVREFLASQAGADFEPDRARESFLFTFHPEGWLQRVR
jgi:cephalosporin hydroxylase